MRNRNTEASIKNQFILMAKIDGVECYLKFRNTENCYFSIVGDIKKADRWNNKDDVCSALDYCRREYKKYNKKKYSKIYFLDHVKIQEVSVVQFTVVHKI